MKSKAMKSHCSNGLELHQANSVKLPDIMEPRVPIDFLYWFQFFLYIFRTSSQITFGVNECEKKLDSSKAYSQASDVKRARLIFTTSL